MTRDKSFCYVETNRLDSHDCPLLHELGPGEGCDSSGSSIRRWNESLHRESMPLAVGYDPAETTHDAFVRRDPRAPGRCNVAVPAEVDPCAASNASHRPTRHG